MPRKKSLSFEDALARLEQITEAMEQGELSLKDLLAHYTEGVALAKECEAMLSSTEKAMDLLLKDEHGEAVATELAIEEGQ